MSQSVAKALLEQAGFQVESLQAVGGGDISAAFRARCGEASLFVKVARRGLETDFEAEAEGLQRMRAAASRLRIPEVIAATSKGLVLEHLEPGRPGPDFDKRLAEGLAEMHEASAEAYGFQCTTYCGATPQPNPWTSSWVDFFIEHRIRHQIRAMRRAGRIDGESEERLGGWADTLSKRLVEPERPGLIHGDLWSGNILSDAEGRPALVDPAAYFGCAEAELGMLTWMGGRSRRFYEAYVSLARLPPDWHERADVYRTYHVMNHATLFGGGYTQDLMALIGRE